MKKTLVLTVMILLLASLISGFLLTSIGKEVLEEDDDYKVDIQTAITDNTYPLGKSIDPSRGGTTDPEPGTHNFSEDGEITVTAIPEEGWRFTHWSGDVPEEKRGEREITISMDEDKNLTANFSILDEDEYIGTEKDSYEPGEKIIIEIKNNGKAGSYPIIVDFGIHIIAVENEKVVYNPDIEVNLPALPPSGRTELLIWNQTDSDGDQVPEGDYIIKAESDAFNHTAEFSISSEEGEGTPGFTMLPLTLAVIISGLTYHKKAVRYDKR
ncbi:MAG: hypothetical protein KGY68_07905 [Candidatus Thermoplasmatota archaeon]|nr:hypothetical protein [Candidatus Thermoplasmatota archaeon]